MYGANYSGFAFHPKAIRMVGPVHFGVFLADWPSCAGPACYGNVRPRPRRTSPSCAKQTATSLRGHSISDRSPNAYPLCHSSHGNGGLSCIQCSLSCAARHDRHPAPITALRLDAPALIPKPDSSEHGPAPNNKNGVFHVKHAARFPPPPLTIKPSSSPARGRFRSRADSAPARPPALPAPTHPFPVHNRSPRSAVPPARSARSTASRHLCRATR